VENLCSSKWHCLDFIWSVISHIYPFSSHYDFLKSQKFETEFVISSGRRKNLAHQNDIVWTLFDPLSTTFIHFWVILIWWRLKNLKSSLGFETDRGPKIKFKWPSIKSVTAL
jgi:hypothetical protein